MRTTETTHSRNLTRHWTRSLFDLRSNFRPDLVSTIVPFIFFFFFFSLLLLIFLFFVVAHHRPSVEYNWTRLKNFAIVNLTFAFPSSSFFLTLQWNMDGEVFEEVYFFFPFFLTNESVAEFMWKKSEGVIWVREIDARMNRRGRTPFIRTCWGTSDSCNRSLADFFSFPIYYLESWKVGSLRNASGFNFDQLGVYYITRSVIFNRMFETKIFLLFFFFVSQI